jgi:hypothetical protein
MPSSHSSHSSEISPLDVDPSRSQRQLSQDSSHIASIKDRPFLHQEAIAKCTVTDIQTFEHQFPFEQMIASYFMRYPTHPRLVLLVSSNVLEDKQVWLDSNGVPVEVTDTADEAAIKLKGYRKGRRVTRFCVLKAQVPE